MSQKRKARILAFDIRITVHTDLAQEFVQGVMWAFIRAHMMFLSERYPACKVEAQDRVLDGKTFAEIKP